MPPRTQQRGDMAVNVDIAIPASVMISITDGSLRTLIAQQRGLNPAITAAATALQDGVLHKLQDPKYHVALEPFLVEVRVNGATKSVQVSGNSTLSDLGHVIDCEHGIQAWKMRLVTTGRTLQNSGFPGGDANQSRRLAMLGITAGHVIWVKAPSPEAVVVTV